MVPQQRPKHIGPNILPNFPIFNRLIGYAARREAVVIKDVTNGFTATHLQLLTDVLHLRNILLGSLPQEVRDTLYTGGEVSFNLLAPGGYEFAVAFLAILAVGGIIVPLCMLFHVALLNYINGNYSSCAPCSRSSVLCGKMPLRRHPQR